MRLHRESFQCRHALNDCSASIPGLHSKMETHSCSASSHSFLFFLVCLHQPAMKSFLVIALVACIAVAALAIVDAQPPSGPVSFPTRT